jgi:protein dithiol oxidoreductase (disulfide-forming)
MRTRSALLTSLLALVLTSVAHGATWTEGVNYFVISPARPTNVPAGKIEVAEVFSYACPFCAQFNPVVRKLQASLPSNAQMVYIPASFNPAEGWPTFQRATCAAQMLGILDETHDKVFDAVWKTGELAISDPQTHRIKNPLPSIEDVAKYYNHISGVPVQKFLDTSKSFAVDTAMRRDDALVTAYRIDSTPSLVVNGKYRITGQSAGGMPQMIEVAKYLVEKESAGGAGKKMAAATSAGGAARKVAAAAPATRK